MDEREWRLNCFGMVTGKTVVKESWINGNYAFLFAKGMKSKIYQDQIPCLMMSVYRNAAGKTEKQTQISHIMFMLYLDNKVTGQLAHL